MTTAGQTLNTGGPIPGTPFGFGAGQARPNAAADPGLVYRSNISDWQAFLCGQFGAALHPKCALIAIDASDLNYPSMAIGDLAGIQTIKRTVKNVGPGATYNVSVSAPSGISVEVSPTSLTLAPGESKSYTVKFTRTSAAFGAFVFGSLTWSDGTHNVRSPIAIRPVVLAAPASFIGSGASGSGNYSIKFGYSGAFSAQPHGLVPATKFVDTVEQDPDQTFDPNDPTGTNAHVVSIPAGTKLARFSLFDAFTDGEDDLDMYVYNPAGVLVGLSAGGTAEEEVNLNNPAAGNYTVYIHGWGTDGPDANYTLFTWAVTPASAGNFSVSAPSSATLGATATVTLNWSGLGADNKYLGTVTYHNVASPANYDDGRIGTTVVRIDVP
jgi:hypothetical protein